MTTDSSRRGTVNADETLFAILNQLHGEEKLGVSELAERLEFSKSAVHKHLKTLEANRFVHNDGGEYRTGLKFLKYGGRIRDENRIAEVSRSKVQELAEETNELVILSVKEFYRGVFMFRWNDQYNLNDTIPLGNRFHLHQNAAGKAMLAELSDNEVQHVINEGLPRATDKTIVDSDALRREISHIREHGFAVNQGERDVEVSAISAAIQGTTEGDLGAISISIPSRIAHREDIIEAYAEPIVQTASKLSLRLKHD